jgi:transcriptional regulator with XRE-family HTH domain
MSAGFVWSKEFVAQLDNEELRNAYMMDQARTRLALQIRALREQRGWSQVELGQRAGKPQNVISRLEDPEYGRLTLETAFTVSGAFGLPVLIEMPEWEDWFERVSDVSSQALQRHSFDLDRLTKLADERAKKSEAGAAFARMWMSEQTMKGLYVAAANHNPIMQQRQSLALENLGTTSDDMSKLAGTAVKAAIRPMPRAA